MAQKCEGGPRVSGQKNTSSLEGKVFTRAQVATHTTLEDRIWVTYQDGVYDITEFIANHPGGSDKIRLAAGKA
eukprot:CAMPEP_0185771048 /NCGR_PEP_ID=MMETSP1174-20130828/62910_1 /TAXON_ID=35687 /ORGANISM="Dictyocha speculum, Strain CCMP1381" /LENGTH=72 /DNA_ID=CAMNT_0028456769 /DNA_START=6 /DNA_END=220 /DNA_ORIENTATION=-